MTPTPSAPPRCPSLGAANSPASEGVGTKRSPRISGDIAYVPLTNGYEAAIDARDLHLIVGRNWNARVKRRKDGAIKAVYAVRMETIGVKRQRMVFMHRLIADAPYGLDVDHADGDGLNNRRENLRVATRAQNNCNLRLRSDNTSGFKGVYWVAKLGKWQAQITVDGKRHAIGYFIAVTDAAKAYADASARLHGKFGRVR